MDEKMIADSARETARIGWLSYMVQEWGMGRS
jgi:hypothetical protein